MINPAPIPSELSLNAGGSWWTKDLPRNLLNSFTNRSKVKFEREKYIGFKEEIGLKIVGDGRVRGGGLLASRGGFLGRGSWLQFRNQSASILPPNIMHFSRDCATIGPRSWSWSFIYRRAFDWPTLHHVNSPIAARSRRDRGSIGPRSWSSSTTPPRRPIELQVTRGSRSRDRDPLSSSVRWRSNRVDETCRHLSKKINYLVKCRWPRHQIRFQRIWSVHV